MSLFDSVYVKCPKCKEKIEFQSKAGGCFMGEYTLEDAPNVILADIADKSAKCKNGHAVKLQSLTRPVLLPLVDY